MNAGVGALAGAEYVVGYIPLGSVEVAIVRRGSLVNRQQARSGPSAEGGRSPLAHRCFEHRTYNPLTRRRIPHTSRRLRRKLTSPCAGLTKCVDPPQLPYTTRPMPNRVRFATLLLTLVALPSAVYAQERAAPAAVSRGAPLSPVPADDPRVPLVKEFLARVMSANRASVEAFLRENGAPSYVGSEQMAADITRVIPQKPTKFEITSFLNGVQGYDLHVLFMADGEQRGVGFSIDAASPLKIARLRFPRITSG